MVVNEGGELSPALRQNATAVKGLCSRFIDRLPAPHLSPPGQIRVFPINEKVLIQILIPQAQVLEHFSLA
jgi:hypothetical protein